MAEYRPPRWEAAFLAALSRLGSQRAAAREIGLHYTTPSIHAARHPEFRERMLAAADLHPKRRRNWQPAFLRALSEYPHIEVATSVAGTTKGRVYAERGRDPDFRKAMDDTIKAAERRLTERARQAASAGPEPLPRMPGWWMVEDYEDVEEPDPERMIPAATSTAEKNSPMDIPTLSE